MNFNRHSELEGQHAFLGASNYHWTNYDEEKLDSVYRKHLAIERGVKLHEFARNAIFLAEKLQKSRKTLNLYVNDSIGYKMTPEQKLVYSFNCHGTADAISFRNNVLRIHDLKTGETPASMRQLEVYAALFCHEYDFRPRDIKIELRIYQSNEVLVYEPNPYDIEYIMDKMVIFDRRIERINSGEEE